MAVSGFKLPAFVLDLAKQPCVLDRQSGLRGKGLKKVDDFRRKAAYFFSPDG